MQLSPKNYCCKKKKKNLKSNKILLKLFINLDLSINTKPLANIFVPQENFLSFPMRPFKIFFSFFYLHPLPPFPGSQYYSKRVYSSCHIHKHKSLRIMKKQVPTISFLQKEAMDYSQKSQVLVPFFHLQTVPSFLLLDPQIPHL